MIFLTALGKLETTVWPWSLLDHGNSFVMGIVEMDWAISPLSCRLWLSYSEIQSLFPRPPSSVVRVIDTDIYLRHSWHPHMLPVTVSRALVCSQTQIRWHPIPRRSNIPPSVFVVVWGKMLWSVITRGSSLSGSPVMRLSPLIVAAKPW